MEIKRIRLYSKKLEAQKAFYVNQLGFELLAFSHNEFTIQTGSTRITFEKSDDHRCYHFAFNIPSFQIEQAFDWLKTKVVEFISNEDSFFIDFKNWNADAVYFYDADGNIAEFIARKNMAIKSEEIFTEKSVLGISEIGMPVMDVGLIYQEMIDKTGLIKYSGDQHYFCAMGSEKGLLIIVDQKVKKWFPTNLPALAVPFKMEAKIEGKLFFIEYTGTKVNIKK